jgi:hypothetical protein
MVYSIIAYSIIVRSIIVHSITIHPIIYYTHPSLHPYIFLWYTYSIMTHSIIIIVHACTLSSYGIHILYYYTLCYYILYYSTRFSHHIRIFSYGIYTLLLNTLPKHLYTFFL